LQDFTNRLAGSAGNKFLTKNRFLKFFKMKSLHLPHQNVYLSSSWRF